MAVNDGPPRDGVYCDVEVNDEMMVLISGTLLISPPYFNCYST